MAFVAPPDLTAAVTKLRAGLPESPEEALTRFTVELEFVQCLANPLYLGYLASCKTLEDASFVAYLEYLVYWKRPEYAARVLYPQSLFFLDMLQKPDFREALKSPAFVSQLRDQQIMHWQHGFNRTRPMTDGEDTKPEIVDTKPDSKVDGPPGT